MSDLNISGLSKSTYLDLLAEVSSYNGNAKLYKENDTLVVVHKSNKPFKSSKLLSFKDITYITYHFKSELLKNHNDCLTTALALDRMIEKNLDHQDKKFILFKLITRICDCVSNLLNGYGFNTTASLAKSLSETLKKAPISVQPKPTPSLTTPSIPQPIHPIPQPISQPQPQPQTIKEPIPGPQPQPIPQPQPRTPTPPTATPVPKPELTRTLSRKFDKKDVLKDYHNAPWDLEDTRKLVVFKDIQGMVNQYRLYYGDIMTLEHLMKFVTDSPLKQLKPVDLNNPKSAQVAIDAFKYCPELVCDALANWLVEQLDRLTKAHASPPFNLELLEKSLEIFITKGKTQQRYSRYSLEQLILLYINPSLDSIRSFRLPIHHKTIASAIELLYTVHPNEKVAVELLTPWILKQPEYDLNLFIQLISVFKHKEETISAQSLYYPARDKLLADFQSRVFWEKDIVNLPGSEDVVQYLKAKGVM